MTKEIKWEAGVKDGKLINKIVDRARKEFQLPGYMILGLTMDLTATHLNGTPLDLPRLLAADLFTFRHDIVGIRRHLNRETGQLENHFLPRTAKREVSE